MSIQKVDVILLAGGKGTRFREVTQDKISKSLYRLNEIELMKYSLRNLDFSLVARLIFALDYHAESVRSWVEEQNFSCEVVFSYQEEPGILGAVTSALEFVASDSYVVCNTDEIREGLFLRDLLEMHQTTSASALATMAATQTNNLHYYRALSLDASGIILKTELKSPYYKEHREIVGYANTGFIVFRRQAVAYFDNTYGNDWSAMIDPLVNARLLQAFLNPNIQYFNVGTLGELEEATEYITHSKVRPNFATL